MSIQREQGFDEVADVLERKALTEENLAWKWGDERIIWNLGCKF